MTVLSRYYWNGKQTLNHRKVIPHKTHYLKQAYQRSQLNEASEQFCQAQSA